MRLSPDDRGQDFVIRGFTDEYVRINDERLNRTFLLTPEQLIHEFPVSSLEDLEKLDATRLLTDAPEVLIFGTGARTQRPSAAFQARLMRSGVGVEFMDTGAACRTYTVLASELRRASLLVIL